MTTETKKPVEQVYNVGDKVRWVGPGAISAGQTLWVTSVESVLPSGKRYTIADVAGVLASGLGPEELEMVSSAGNQARAGMGVLQVTLETSQAILEVSKRIGIEPDDLINVAIHWVGLVKENPGGAANGEIVSAAGVGSMIRAASTVDRAVSAFERWVDLQEVIAVNAGERLKKQDADVDALMPLLPQIIESLTGVKMPKPKRPKVEVDHLKPVPPPAEDDKS